MLHCRRQSQGAPHWVAYFPHWVSADAHVASEFPTSGLGRGAWHFSLDFPGWGVAAKLLDIPGVDGILSDLHKSNQLLTVRC